MSFSKSGLEVPALGLGAGALGDPALSEVNVHALLSKALELGVTLIDTAPSYGDSEARIGSFVDRAHFIISTKLGYGVPGVPDWTAECITKGVDLALKRLNVETLDIAHLHSCPKHVLQRGEVIQALQVAHEAGKVKVPAYSGDNEALGYAVSCGAFKSVQASLNLVDQRNAETLKVAKAAGLGVIAKRPLANAPWRFEQQPTRGEAEYYWHRWQRFLPIDFDPLSLFLRFVLGRQDVDVVLVGTRSISRLQENVRVAAKGPLPASVLAMLKTKYKAVGADWPARI